MNWTQVRICKDLLREDEERGMSFIWRLQAAVCSRGPCTGARHELDEYGQPSSNHSILLHLKFR